MATEISMTVFHLVDHDQRLLVDTPEERIQEIELSEVEDKAVMEV